MKYYNNGGVTSGALGQSSSLSPWAGGYVTDMLAKGKALSEQPYQAYMGPLTAGASDLQTQAFQGLANLTIPTAAQMTYTPMSFTGGSFAQPMAQQPMAQQPRYQGLMTQQPMAGQDIPYYMRDSFDPEPGASMGDLPLAVQQIAERFSPTSQTSLGPTDVPIGIDYELFGSSPQDIPTYEYERSRATPQPGGLLGGVGTPAGTTQQQPRQQSPVEQYMSPYIQAALEPQLAEAQRQAEIQRVQNASRLGKAGAFGGSRQAIMESEGQRNLLRNLADITGKGYQTAFEQAQSQFNTEQDRAMQAARQAQTYGLEALRAQQTGGGIQRAIEQEGIAADIAQFEEERDYPYKQLQFQQSLLQGLPISTQSYQYAEPSLLSNIMGGSAGILSILDALNKLGNSGTATTTNSGGN